MLRWIWAASLAFATNAGAAEFCATNSAELAQAMTDASVNGQPDVIRVAQGTYVTPGANGFVYDSLAPVGGDSQDITIVGGFVPFFNNPCGTNAGSRPWDTLVDGDRTSRVMRITSRGDTKITIRNLWLANGFLDPNGFERGAGLRADVSFGTDQGHLRVENCIFTGNSARFESAVSVRGGESYRFSGNLVVANEALAHAVAFVTQGTQETYAINNTIFGNSSLGGSSNAGLYLATSGGAKAFAANNLLWGNDGDDLDLFSEAIGGEYYGYNNSIESQSGVFDVESGNLSTAPEFAPGLLNFDLAPTSALIDAGRMPPAFVIIPTPFASNWSLTDFDVLGRNRVQGQRVDIGAFEAAADRLFSDGFE